MSKPLTEEQIEAIWRDVEHCRYLAKSYSCTLGSIRPEIDAARLAALLTDLETLQRQLTEAQQRIQALEQARAWQPIATAPKMEYLLLHDRHNPSFNVFIGCYHTAERCWAATLHGKRRVIVPTHWQSLPAPPDPTE